MRMRNLGLVLLAGAVVVAAAGCGGNRVDGAGGSGATPTYVSSAGTTLPGTTLPGTTQPGGAAGSGTAVPPATVAPASGTTGKAVDKTLRTPDGRERTYHVYVPTTFDPSGAPVPLLVALHGGVGWGTQFEANSGFDGLAEANGFIVVYPDGIGSQVKDDALRTWNGGACCGNAVKQNVDDVGFISQLIDTLAQDYPIDPTRVYAAGHSNGGIMSYRLACELSDKIVAIGIQSGTMEIDSCHPAKPVSVLHIHGTADQNLPITGGKGTQGISGEDFKPPADGIAKVRAANGCPANATEQVDPANADITRTTWEPCRDGTAVEFVQVAGASHAWMGHKTSAPRLVGESYQGLDSSLAIWTFLAAHPRQ